ncbi:MAG: peptidylprolyl isomerase [Chloroflexi bacterium]|nr:peptidylprolyl isomerase [Chloroflexota bacterium]MBU1749181.1 peptidylprolyl isomerase [Chloroflexota bacterium]
MTIDPTKSYVATVETTKGTFVMQLLPDAAPQTVNSFVFLARDGFYDGLTFHRVEDWVVQGGDPKGTGTSGPGYTIPDEFGSSRTYSQVRGIVGLARPQAPNSGGSQWYVVKQDASWLDGQYTTFGKVTEGMDVVDKLAIGDVMTRITIQESE